MQFTDLGINNQLVQAITELGFTTPTAIQVQAIPILLSGNKDFIGLAQTGTGKTAAFGIPLIQAIDTSHTKPQAIILCPTRELCIQITKELKKYAKYHKEIAIVALYGGASLEEQIREIKRGAHIVVATPGRIMDHLNRRSIKLDTISTVVLDEADEMLNKGFKEDIDTILSSIPKQRKIWLFSATMPHEIETIVKNYMINPERIVVGNKNSAGANIQFHYCLVDSNTHYQAFKRLVDFHPEFYGIVFCRTRHDVRKLHERLLRDNYDADALHGDLSQKQREIVMQKLRSKKIRILIATDVAARGIDVNGLTHVVHYHLPENQEHYTHRCGRTGRAGNNGISISLIHPREVRKIESMHRSIKQPINAMKIPSGLEVGKQYIHNFVQKLNNIKVDEERIKPYVEIAESILGSLSKEDLLKKILLFNSAEVINQATADLTVQNTQSAGSDRDYRRSGNNSFFARRRNQRRNRSFSR